MYTLEKKEQNLEKLQKEMQTFIVFIYYTYINMEIIF